MGKSEDRITNLISELEDIPNPRLLELQKKKEEEEEKVRLALEQQADLVEQIIYLSNKIYSNDSSAKEFLTVTNTSGVPEDPRNIVSYTYDEKNGSIIYVRPPVPAPFTKIEIDL